ncbi:MAG: YfiR family protein [Vicinamibacterales bacterium]|jgi:hypothetical protein
MTTARRGHLGAPGLAGIVMATCLLTPVMAVDLHAQVAPGAAVKAAFIYNFAKFTEWPALAPGLPIVVCIVGDDGIGAAFAETVRGQSINGHSLELGRPKDSTEWPGCQVLFVAEAQIRQATSGLTAVRTAPVLTVSDNRGFAESGGIIELYVESGRMRFAINVDAVERSGPRLSSRLLGLAKVIRDRSSQ